jgi:hypothetical protein
MYEGKYKTTITNPNEITKGEFDELMKIKEYDQFSENEINTAMANLSGLISKAEKEELSEEEQYLIKSTSAELKNLTKYTINDMVEGRIVKTDIFIQPKQVRWEETLEKSLDGENIVKGIFLDTELNRELGRVGVTFEKGKSSMKKSEDKESDAKEEYDEDMMKAAMAMVKKGIENKDMYKGMKEKYPGAEDKMVKACMKKAYKSMSEDYMKKAEMEIEISGDDDDKKEDKEEKGKK